MVGVIAAAANANGTVRKESSTAGYGDGGGTMDRKRIEQNIKGRGEGSVTLTPVPTERDAAVGYGERGTTGRTPKPWETPTDLSGYTRRESPPTSGRTSYDRDNHRHEGLASTYNTPNSHPAQSHDAAGHTPGVKTPLEPNAPAHAPYGGATLPLPPKITTPLKIPLSFPHTPETPGKIQPRTPNEFRAAASSFHPYHGYYGTATTPADNVNPPLVQPEEDRMLFHEEITPHVDNRKEQARMRVQRYLNEIDDRVRSIKHGGSGNGRRARQAQQGRPELVARGVSDSVAMARHRQQRQREHDVVRPWDSFDVGMVSRHDERVASVHDGGRQKEVGGRKPMRVYLPTLESPGDGWEQREQRMQQHQQHQRQQHQQQGMFSNSPAHRANVTLVEEARADAENLMKQLPFDERTDAHQPRRDDGHLRTESRDAVGQHHDHGSKATPVPPPPFNGPSGSMATPNTMVQTPSFGAASAFTATPSNGSTDEHTLPITTDELIRQAKKSVGLRSLREYKQLLQQKESEMDELEKLFQSEMDKNDQDLGDRDEEIRHFRAAMEEAERTVSALDAT